DKLVTGVQTCALPILPTDDRSPTDNQSVGWPRWLSRRLERAGRTSLASLEMCRNRPPLCRSAHMARAHARRRLPGALRLALALKIGRASCRERVEIGV